MKSTGGGRSEGGLLSTGTRGGSGNDGWSVLSGGGLSDGTQGGDSGSTG